MNRWEVGGNVTKQHKTDVEQGPYCTGLEISCYHWESYKGRDFHVDIGWITLGRDFHVNIGRITLGRDFHVNIGWITLGRNFHVNIGWITLGRNFHVNIGWITLGQIVRAS
jgi:hypothetical protein